jgi:hypothetical protein
MHIIGGPVVKRHIEDALDARVDAVEEHGSAG